MDTTLATVTIISLLLAWAMALVTRQRLRAERRRSDARLADLMAEFARADGRAGGAADAELPHLNGGERAPRRVADDAVPPAPAAGAGSSPRRAGLAPIPPASTHWSRGSAAVAVATLLVAGIYFTERTTLSRVGVHLAERIPLPGVGVHLAGRTPLLRTGADLPVELLSLDHRRQGDYLAVSGSLRNPSGGRGRSKLSVAATAFDRSGAIVGTGQAPLPVEALPAGDETAFTISLPDADLISRYRVSFMEDQSELPHVDRRGSDAAMPAAAGRRP